MNQIRSSDKAGETVEFGEGAASSASSAGKSAVSLTVFWLWEAFAAASVVYSVAGGNWQHLAISAVSLLLFPATYAAEKLFRIRFTTAMRILCMCFCAGPLLGHVYMLYYVAFPWDKLLHTISGFITAAIGYQLPQLLDKGNGSHSPVLKCVSALCFSLAVAGVWEFFEFGMEQMFGFDMQSDTVVSSVNSYFLGGSTGVSMAIPQVGSLTVNGVALDIGGYLDIGLIDTMADMLVCTLGSIVFTALTAIKKGKLINWMLPEADERAHRRRKKHNEKQTSVV